MLTEVGKTIHVNNEHFNQKLENMKKKRPKEK